MNCRTCNYPLWNIRDRRCPECGMAFLPQEFRFVPGAVQFCCPHCSQAYYGTTRDGHLDPPRFACATCGEPVSMNEMVLLPTQGVPEDRTGADRMPWLDDQRGFLGRWFATIGWALASPTKLIERTPLMSSLWSAAGFSLLTTSLYIAVFALPLCGLFALGTAGPARGADALLVIAYALLVFAIVVASTLVTTVLWAMVAHLLLLMGGAVEGGLRRTVQCFFYASAANVFLAIPCFGMYAAILAWVWSAVSAILMISRSQRVSGGRASFAVLAAPITLSFLAFVGVAFMVLPAWTATVTTARNVATQQAAMAASRAVQPNQVLTAQTVLNALLSRPGGPPLHAARLATEGVVAPTQFLFAPALSPSDIPVGNTDLATLYRMSPASQEFELSAAEAAMPKDLVAHRIGDYVFTHHGMDLTTADGGLWLFMAEASTDPRAQLWLVGRADGVVIPVAPEGIPPLLKAQNALRRQAGLPPLPHPADVGRIWPAPEAK